MGNSPSSSEATSTSQFRARSRIGLRRWPNRASTCDILPTRSALCGTFWLPPLLSTKFQNCRTGLVRLDSIMSHTEPLQPWVLNRAPLNEPPLRDDSGRLVMPTRKRSDVDSQPRMAGPLWIHTLRGELLGRQVALVCCGEAHEGTVLTLGFTLERAPPHTLYGARCRPTIDLHDRPRQCLRRDAVVAVPHIALATIHPHLVASCCLTTLPPH